MSVCRLWPGTAQTEGFEDILNASRRNNGRWSITGALLFHDEHFLQVLEGPRKPVEDLFTTIREDDRHEKVNRLGTDLIGRRRFASWSMGFIQPGSAGSAFIGLSIDELRSAENDTAGPVIDWMCASLTGTDPN